MDSESLGSISEDSDFFNAETFDELSFRWRTEQDEDIRRATYLAGFLRKHALLLPHPQDATKDWLQTEHGEKLPAVHCAFAGCPWI